MNNLTELAPYLYVALFACAVAYVVVMIVKTSKSTQKKDMVEKIKKYAIEAIQESGIKIEDIISEDSIRNTDVYVKVNAKFPTISKFLTEQEVIDIILAIAKEIYSDLTTEETE